MNEYKLPLVKFVFSVIGWNSLQDEGYREWGLMCYFRYRYLRPLGYLVEQVTSLARNSGFKPPF